MQHRAAIVWCVPTDTDPVRDLTDEQRVAVLNTIFPSDVVRPITALAAPLKAFPLGLSAQRTLVDAARHRAHWQRRANLAPGGWSGPEPRAARRVRLGRVLRLHVERTVGGMKL